MGDQINMDTVTMVAIALLGAIFVGSMVALIVVCRHKYCKKLDILSRQNKDQEPDANLVENMEGQTESPSGLELDDVVNTNWEEILNNEAWVNDASGLAPYCLEILKTCHQLTEKLVGMTMGNAQNLRSMESVTDMVAIAKRVGARVDDVMNALYPPLDPRLLEARCASLVLQVSHLVMVTKSACRLSGVLDWVDQSLADLEDHLRVLREASRAYECNMIANAANMEASQSTPASSRHGSHSQTSQTTNQNPQVITVSAPPMSESSDV